MKRFKYCVWLLLYGSLWGISEVIAGGILYRDTVPYASVWLAAWAVFVLAVARGVLNKPGSSTVIAAFAVIFKVVNTTPFFCHLLAIFFLGLAFDIASSLLMKHERKISYRSSISGALSTYGGYALFALVITYIVRYEYWAVGGLTKVLHHIFVSGSLAALTAVIAVPLGYWIGVNGWIMAERRWSWAYTWAFVALIILWTLGRIAG
jgi:hypothetical protein